MEKAKTINVEVWSDVVCPFCYLGKAHFEKALQQFPHKENVEVEWKSFQLNPDAKSHTGKNINQYLAETKGWTEDYARQLHERLTQSGKAAGLVYDFDNTIVANTFDAHRLIQFAKTKGKG